MLCPSTPHRCAAWPLRFSHDLQLLREQHANYASQRWGLLEVAHFLLRKFPWCTEAHVVFVQEADKELVENNGWVRPLREFGVAGMRDHTGVKCLHTHYAHFLATVGTGNLIGQWVDELLESSQDSSDYRPKDDKSIVRAKDSNTKAKLATKGEPTVE